jgi:hypothetical protein
MPRTQRIIQAAAVLTSLALAAAGCGPNPKSVRVTDGDPDVVLAQIGTMKGLTVEETALLHRRIARVRIEAPDSPEPPDLVGRTVGELIEEERTWETVHAEAIAAGQEHARSWKERVAAQTRAMNEALSVQVLETTDIPDDGDPRPSTRRVLARIAIQNQGSREVSEVEGALRFSDVYGRDLFDCSFTLHLGLPRGETTTVSQPLDCAPFRDDASVMRGARLPDTKVTWDPRMIRYNNGTVLTITDE